MSFGCFGKPIVGVLMGKLCSICGKSISRDWFCYKCYQTYKKAIEGNEPWIRYVQNCEKKRRRTPTLPVIYLGDKYDITDDGQLIIKDGYYGR